MNKPKLVISSGYAAITTTVFVVAITIWAELSVPLKSWLANFSGHHWTSKSVFTVLLYVVVAGIFYLFPNKHGEDHLRGVLKSLLVFTIFGTVIITLFFTGHHFKLF